MDILKKRLKEKGKVSLPFKPLDTTRKDLEKLGFKNRREEFDINGWQIDFWDYYTLNNESYTLSGSFFYGNYELTKD